MQDCNVIKQERISDNRYKYTSNVCGNKIYKFNMLQKLLEIYAIFVF